MFNFPSRRKSNIQQNGGKEKKRLCFVPDGLIRAQRGRGTDKSWLSIRLYSWPGCLTPLACGDRRLELCLAADHTSVRETVETEIEVGPLESGQEENSLLSFILTKPEFTQDVSSVKHDKDERDRVQKKTFTKWVNKHLIKVRKHISDLYEDLRDGHNLISLLEVLSGVTLPREKGRMRFHRLQNVQIALDFLKQRQVKLVNIRNDDITDGNPKLTLGLIWTIILHFQSTSGAYPRCLFLIRSSGQLLHRRTAPPDEEDACLSNWQVDSRRFVIGQYWDTIPSQLLREYDFKVGERGGSFRLVSRGEACDAKLSGELKVESVCNELPPELDQHPILWIFRTVAS
ncbi:Microtubule-actin cross-linking factor 1 [Collichthys lucidus]|uniref:Microtubule-actin cross-linking factor 1 n=1 Tax=Collichthys lucidus TaxID=240159 RepID=A0A4U5VKM0_COLLU|nr:Microtubule-actin cross-linking factor 1 [Collichthys lucidus]